MEFLNKIEIAGVVGRANLTPCGPTTVCNFSVMTEYCYKGNDGGVVVDTLWLSVTACGPKPQWPDLSQIQKGSKVHIIGRFRAKRYVDNSGCDRTMPNWAYTQYKIRGSEKEVAALHSRIERRAVVVI